MAVVRRVVPKERLAGHRRSRNNRAARAARNEMTSNSSHSVISTRNSTCKTATIPSFSVPHHPPLVQVASCSVKSNSRLDHRQAGLYESRFSPQQPTTSRTTNQPNGPKRERRQQAIPSDRPGSHSAIARARVQTLARKGRSCVFVR